MILTTVQLVRIEESPNPVDRDKHLDGLRQGSGEHEHWQTDDGEERQADKDLVRAEDGLRIEPAVRGKAREGDEERAASEHEIGEGPEFGASAEDGDLLPALVHDPGHEGRLPGVQLQRLDASEDLQGDTCALTNNASFKFRGHA